MEQQDKPAGELTREIIAGKLAAFDARDRELTRQLIAMFEDNGSGLGRPRTPARHTEPTKAQRLKALMNGAGSLVPDDAAPSPTEGDLLEEREDIRDSMRLLMNAEQQLVTAANTEWARAHLAEYRALMKGLLLDLAAADRRQGRLLAFLERAAGAEVELPLERYVGAIAIDIPPISLETLLAEAVKAGVITETEHRNAGNARH
jgi:hypothetical protein